MPTNCLNAPPLTQNLQRSPVRVVRRTTIRPNAAAHANDLGARICRLVSANVSSHRQPRDQLVVRGLSRTSGCDDRSGEWSCGAFLNVLGPIASGSRGDETTPTGVQVIRFGSNQAYPG